MRVAVYRKKGSAEDVLSVETWDKPVPGAGDVLVRIMASGINPSDVKMRAGQSIGGMDMPFPDIIPHSDGAGVVEAVGSAVSQFMPGDRVYVYNAGYKRAHGTASDYVCLPVSQVLPLPEETSFAHGACLGIPAMTAVHAITRAKSIEGKTVYISGGGGVVGRYAIEVAVAMGASHIITTASSDTSKATATQAGANAILDYRDADLSAQILHASDGGVDHAVEAEFGANVELLSQIVKPNGSIAAYGSALVKQPTLPFYDFMFKNISLHMMLIYLLDAEDRIQAAAHVNHLLTTGGISENIAERYSLADIAMAHKAVETGNKSGSVILDLTKE